MRRTTHLNIGDRVRWRWRRHYFGEGSVAFVYPAPPRTNRWIYEVWWDNGTRSKAGGAELVLVSRHKEIRK